MIAIVLLTLVASLVLAPSAMAEGETAGTVTTSTETGETSAEQPATKPAEGETQPTGGGEQVTTTGGEKSASEPPPGGGEEHAPAPPPTSGETTTPPTSGEAPPTPTPGEPAPTVTVTEEPTKKAPAGGGEETPAAPTGSVGAALVSSQSAKSGEERSPDAVLPTTTIDAMPPGATTAGLQEQAPAIIAAGAVGARADIAASQLTNAFSCGLSVLEHATIGCPGGGGGGQFPADSAVGLAAAVASLSAGGDDGSSNHGGPRGDSSVGTAPAGSGPGSSPGGSTGGATGGSGLGLSAFITLAGLLLLGAPRLLRRLRISCGQWRATCFALIPERPG